MSDTTAPAKVQRIIDHAQRQGLTVKREKDAGDLQAWTIGTPNPIDNTQVWLYYTPGPRGGRLAITIYYGSHTKPKRNAPRRWAFYTIENMADSLKRHQEREARGIAEEAQQIADRETVSDADLQAAIDTAETAGATNRVAVYRQARKIRAARVAMAQLGRELDGMEIPNDEETQRAERFGLTVHQLRAASDPAQPGWFAVGQGIADRASGTHHRVSIIEHDSVGKVARVAVSTNGGYGGKLHWYGDHPEAVAGLDALEGPHVGMDDTARRPWPRGLASAHATIANVLRDQCLSGWAVGVVEPDRIIVNVMHGTDPTRHLILLERYVPYLNVDVRLTPRSEVSRSHYPAITITPKGE